MLKVVNIVFAGGAVAIALVTGFLMQTNSSDRSATEQYASLENSSASDVTVPEVSGTTQIAKPKSEKPALASISPIAQIFPSEPDASPLTTASLDISLSVAEKILPKPNLMDAAQPPKEIVARFETSAISDSPIAFASEPQPSADCTATLTADPTAAAMVQLEVQAPCHVKERLTVHHAGMMFTEVTDEDGQLSLKVPALSENALFMVSFATGKTLVAQTEVTSLGFYDRAVVQWEGDVTLQIHALEFGADYGGERHVWAENQGSVQKTVSGLSGFITRYGDASSPEALFAEVYTFPSLTSKTEGQVHLSVEAEVTSKNCSKGVEAQSIQYSGDHGLNVQDLVLQMPDCDDFGGYLVLKNLLEDLTIAHK